MTQFRKFLFQHRLWSELNRSITAGWDLLRLAGASALVADGNAGSSSSSIWAHSPGHWTTTQEQNQLAR